MAIGSTGNMARWEAWPATRCSGLVTGAWSLNSGNVPSASWTSVRSSASGQRSSIVATTRSAPPGWVR